MHIDCDLCVAKDTGACDDCVVTFILNPSRPFDLEDDEVEALELLAEEGLVPRLRLRLAPHPLSDTA
jgi:hypothetical protein